MILDVHEQDLPPYAASVFQNHFNRTHRRRTGFITLVLTPLIALGVAIMLPLLELPTIANAILVHSSVLLAAAAAITMEYADLNLTHSFRYIIRDSVETTLYSRSYERDSQQTSYWLVIQKTEGEDIVLRGYQPGEQKRIIITDVVMRSDATTIPIRGEEHYAEGYSYETASVSEWGRYEEASRRAV